MEFLLNAHPLAYLVVVVVGTLFFLPGSVTMTLAGFLYGFMPGLLYASIAIPVGAQCAFEAGRRLGRPWVERRLSKTPRMRALQSGLREEAFTIVILSRLSLVVPFNVLNYVCGASSMRGRTYFAATTLGMLPAILLYVYLGTLARDLGDVLSGRSTPPALSYWIAGFGLSFIVVILVIIRRAAVRALRRHLEGEIDMGSVE